MLTFTNLTLERYDKRLFKPVSGVLRSGELLQITGTNGSGKSTLLRMIAGFIEPHTGCVRWHGQDVLTQRADYQQQVHYVGHQHGIKAYLTLTENLQLYAALRGDTISTSMMTTVLDKLGLAYHAEQQTQHLSAGQKRRLSLARLLIKPLPLWILDEPATALDAEGQKLLLQLIIQQLESGGMVLLATHQLLQLSQGVTWLHLE